MPETFSPDNDMPNSHDDPQTGGGGAKSTADSKPSPQEYFYGFCHDLHNRFFHNYGQNPSTLDNFEYALNEIILGKDVTGRNPYDVSAGLNKFVTALEALRTDIIVNALGEKVEEVADALEAIKNAHPDNLRIQGLAEAIGHHLDIVREEIRLDEYIQTYNSQLSSCIGSITQFLGIVRPTEKPNEGQRQLSEIVVPILSRFYENGKLTEPNDQFYLRVTADAYLEFQFPYINHDLRIGDQDASGAKIRPIFFIAGGDSKLAFGVAEALINGMRAEGENQGILVTFHPDKGKYREFMRARMHACYDEGVEGLIGAKMIVVPRDAFKN